jgi:hypothetical protein
MKKSYLIIMSIMCGIIITIISGFPLKLQFSAPGGSEYGAGFPAVWRIKISAGEGPNPVRFNYLVLMFIEDIIFWFAIVAIILFATGYVKSR